MRRRGGRLGSVIVIAKEPLAGRVKTRLSPPFSLEQAADLARAALTDTLTAAAAVPARQHVIALDGRPGGLPVDGWSVVPQAGGGLDARLTVAFSGCVGRGAAILVGMDTPQLRPEQLRRFDYRSYDACIGLAPDGGYWAIGFADPRRAVSCIPGVPMSTASTGAIQLARLTAAGLSVQLLESLTDVDTAASARQVARGAPGTGFARLLDRFDAEGGPGAVDGSSPRLAGTIRC